METQRHQEPVTTEETRAVLRDAARLQKEAKERDERRRKEYEARRKEYEAWKKAFDRRAEKRMNKIEGTFTGQWGKLVESLVEGDLVSLLQARGASVEETATRVRGEAVASITSLTSWRRTRWTWWRSRSRVC